MPEDKPLPIGEAFYRKRPSRRHGGLRSQGSSRRRSQTSHYREGEWRSRLVIVSFQSFFGLGEGDHALGWNRLNYDLDLGGYRTDVTEQELKVAPDFTLHDDHEDP